jgi:2-polyprenyl-6-methoxyphenol hydroxylase-like FAD-dependent oxidoreductase
VPPPRVLPLAGAPAPASFPLRLLAAGTYVAPRVALVGDAARAVHPLAGQGANLGFADAACLASALAEGAAAGVDPGDAAWLSLKYDAPRRRAAATMQAALDGLAAVFGPQTGPLAVARGVGLAAVDALAPVRAAVVRFASGG